MTILKVGIAGYGVVGKRRKKCIDLHANMRVSAVCDREFDGAGMLNDEVRYFSSYKELLGEDLDVLFVCMTNDIAAEVTIAGLKKGLNVFCEKPPGRNVEEIRRVIEQERNDKK